MNVLTQQDPALMHIFADNIDGKRFEYEIDGQKAFANYRRNGSILYIDHVEAPVAMRGKGVASTLMKHIHAKAKREGWQIMPICGYASLWLRRHQEEQDALKEQQA